MDRQNKIAISFLFLGVFLTYSTYILKRSQTDIRRQFANMLALQLQADCLRTNDIPCALKANKLMSSFTAQALDDSSFFLLDSNAKRAIKEFIAKEKHYGE